MNTHFLFAAIILAALVIEQNMLGELVVYNDTASTITARCLGKGNMQRRTTVAASKKKMGCAPSFVSEGIEVEVQDPQVREMLKETWAPVGMLEPAGKRIEIHVKQEFDAKSGAIYKIVLKK